MFVDFGEQLLAYRIRTPPMTIRFHHASGHNKGFTLPEIIVSITLIAILASVVVPTVVSQVKKGDPSRMGSDFLAVRGASEQFLSDVRRYPASISQLAAPITTIMSPLTGTSLSTYGNPETQRWRGPYLSKDASAALSTGFGLSFNDSFEVDALPPNGTSSVVGGQKYMVLTVTTTVDTASINDFDRQFDDGVPTTGSIRSTSSKIMMLVMPIY